MILATENTEITESDFQHVISEASVNSVANELGVGYAV